MPPENESPYRRLARLLAQRRPELGARYKNKNLFAEERGLERRMLWRIEKGDDSNYTPETLADVEEAYMLVPGSLPRTLAGGPLEPAAALRVPVPSEKALALFDGDVTKALIWEAGELESENGGDGDQLAADLMQVLNRWRSGKRSRNEETA